MCEEVYTFLVNQLLHRYFSRILPRFSEHLFFFPNISIFPFNCCRSIYYKLEIEPVIPALHQLKEGLDQIGLLESMCVTHSTINLVTLQVQNQIWKA